MANREEPRRTARVTGAIPQADLFHRKQPAWHEPPPDPWLVTRAVIDFGGAVVNVAREGRAEQPMRDLVTMALLRRALITAEGVYRLLAGGLVEAALALDRSLIDIDLNLSLVTADPTDRMAKRLAAYHYLHGQRHGERMMHDPVSRTALAQDGDHLAQARLASKNFAAMLRMPVFDDVRDDVIKSRFWHGYSSPADAFAAVGGQHDYRVSYDLATAFVHDVNVDHDYASVSENGRDFRLKPFVERDPARLRPLLGGLAFRLLLFLQRFIDDRGLRDRLEALEANQAPEEKSAGTDNSDGDVVLRMSGLELLTFKVHEVFGSLDDVVAAFEASLSETGEPSGDAASGQ